MRTPLVVIGALLLPVALTLSAVAAAVLLTGDGHCQRLSRPSLPGTRILAMSAVAHPDGMDARASRPGRPVASGVPAFCDVTIILTHPPLRDRVRVQVWLPQSTWNGRFQATGGGAFAAGEFERALVPAVRRGYAAASTDAGVPSTAKSPPVWAQRHDRPINDGLLANFAYRSVHEMSRIGKQVIAGFYGRPPAYSYFTGCSTGGRQGLTEAQRYPGDFDGILADAPAIAWNRLTLAQFWPQVVMNEAGTYPTACEFAAFNRAAIAACDTDDGRLDGIIGRPDTCRFDPGRLVGTSVRCHGRTIRISRVDADIVGRIWDGPTTRTGERQWYGLPRGASFSWLAGTTKPLFGPRHGAPFPVAADWIHYFLLRQPHLDVSTIGYAEFERLFEESQARYGAVIGSDDPDLSAFRAAGGKMITWHGLADPAVFPQGTVDYRRRVESAMGGGEATDRFYRVFLAPGVGHCSGGAGPVPTDPHAALVDWVEHDRAPDTLPAATTGAHPHLSGVLCRYPQQATAGRPCH
ncbi:tannase/feruloyl esterase family alpha/beta hydrolase [Dactylosporangium sp. NPDC006015]|uniref:tannase/feruloyl esterase family alpha/beta hydrolase n=1 Tax=Dactylosporangium sp. NPDC006015 TaxID=3154576 RepID=UPI0033B10A59